MTMYRTGYREDITNQDSSHYEGPMSLIWRSSLCHRVQLTHCTDYYSLTSHPREIIQGLGIPRISLILKWSLCGASWNPVNLMIQSERSQKNLSRNTAVVWTPQCIVLLSALALQTVSKELEFLKW